VLVKKKDLQLIGRNAARLERLSADILDVSRIESGSFRINKEEFDINALVIEAIDIVAKRIGVEKLQINADLPNYQVMVVADRDRIMQVLSNLLSNAIRFDPLGRILITLDQKHNEVSVKVKDSGSGISDDFRPRLFSKFASTLRNSSGTGLGLYLSKSIIEAHGGVIWGENNSDGAGAVFGFTIPLTTNFSTSLSE
jgi:signal transduction histidine kinase